MYIDKCVSAPLSNLTLRSLAAASCSVKWNSPVSPIWFQKTRDNCLIKNEWNQLEKSIMYICRDEGGETNCLRFLSSCARSISNFSTCYIERINKWPFMLHILLTVCLFDAYQANLYIFRVMFLTSRIAYNAGELLASSWIHRKRFSNHFQLLDDGLCWESDRILIVTYSQLIYNFKKKLWKLSLDLNCVGISGQEKKLPFCRNMYTEMINDKNLVMCTDTHQNLVLFELKVTLKMYSW